jgi:DNA-binding NarL/FixJ family response regulator
MTKIKILLAEDHVIVRQGLKALIYAAQDMEIAGEAEDGRVAVQVAQRVRPDVVLMDVAMPRMNGLEATKQIRARLPQTRVLVLSSYTDDDLVEQLVQAGAAGYLTKHAASHDLLEAIRRIHRGESYFSPSIVSRRRQQIRNLSLNGHSSNRKRELTSRENEVLTMIALGLGSKQMAGQLHLSVKTIEKHRQQVMVKLDIHEIASLTRYAASHGLISLDQKAAA